MSIRSLTAARVGLVCLWLPCSLAAAQGSSNPRRPGWTEPAYQAAPLVIDLSRSDSELLGRQAFDAPGSVLRTPRLHVAGGDVELAERIASMVEETVAALPPALVDGDVRIRVNVRRPDGGVCPARAFAYASGSYGFIDVLVDEAWPESTLRRVVAHEVGHVYHFASRGEIEGIEGDGILIEGLASWLARDAWLRDLGFASFDDAVRSYLENGTYVSLAQEYEVDVAAVVASPAECFALRDQLYTQWAGFVGYLQGRFGLDAVLAATEQSREVLAEQGGVSTLAPLDYEAAFAAPLEELERDWLGRLDGP